MRLEVHTEALAELQNAAVYYESREAGLGFRFDLRLKGETVWPNQPQMADLFARERTVITKHLRIILRQGE